MIWRSGTLDALTFHYATDRRKAFFHPVRPADGVVLTDFEPADHPWHRGIWFSWKYLNGINFWEETADGTQDGRTEFAGIEQASYQSDRTQLALRYHYQAPQGELLLQEQRTLSIAYTSEAMWTIDWDMTFLAPARAVCLDRTPVAPQTPWGGYAGLSFRAAPTWGDVQGIDSEGRKDLEIKHQRACWVSMSGQTAEGQRTSIAMLDHPDNLRHPTYWYYADETDPLGFAYLNPSPLLTEPYTLDAGGGLRLRYRLLIHNGVLAPEEVSRQYAEFERGS
jgi:hypothetical protein